MIIPVETLLVFIPVALALNFTPGADMLFCLARGSSAGPMAGIAAALGIATGAFIHAFVAGVGLAVVLATYPIAFEVLRWSGVIYLLYLAYTSLKQPIANAQPEPVSKADIVKAWRDGTLVCFFNPKVALFILALVPQFVDPDRGSVFIQFMIFGAILNIGGTVINILVGVFSGSVGRTLAKNKSLARWLQWISSALLIGIAFRLAFDKR